MKVSGEPGILENLQRLLFSCSWHRIFYTQLDQLFAQIAVSAGSHRLYLWNERCNRTQPDGSGLCIDSLSGAGKPRLGEVSAGNSGL